MSLVVVAAPAATVVAQRGGDKDSGDGAGLDGRASAAEVEELLAGLGANLDGQLEQQAKNIIAAMDKSGVKRLIFVSSMGIYDEIPGERHGSILEPYCRSAALVEASDLDYTIVRPAWLNNTDEIDYETTQKGDPFKNPGAVVSQSVADFIVKTALSSNLHSHASLGV